jgi:hypothetical protein
MLLERPEEKETTQRQDEKFTKEEDSMEYT